MTKIKWISPRVLSKGVIFVFCGEKDERTFMFVVGKSERVKTRIFEDDVISERSLNFTNTLVV